MDLKNLKDAKAAQFVSRDGSLRDLTNILD